MDVQFANLEAELKQSISSGIPKACLFNLILFSKDPQRTTYFQDVVRLIGTQFPCRVIFIQEVKASSLKVSVSVETREEAPGLICEQIFLEAGHQELARIPFIILPLIVPDLPIYLLWGQDPLTEKVILPTLQPYASRLIFDSEGSDNLQLFAQNMLKLLKNHPTQITDMNWARMGGWRQVLAQTFDCQERVDQLSSSKTIKIIYNNRVTDLTLHPQRQALYLQAWLAVQLGWEFDRIEHDQASIRLYYKNGPDVILEGKVESHFSSEEILEIEMTDQAHFLYSFKRKGPEQVIIYCNTMDRCELPFTLLLPNIWSGRVFMREVLYHPTSVQYAHMLELISRLPRN